MHWRILKSRDKRTQLLVVVNCSVNSGLNKVIINIVMITIILLLLWWRRRRKRWNSPFLVVLHAGGRVPLPVGAQRYVPLCRSLVERTSAVRALNQVRVNLVVLVRRRVLQLRWQVLYRASCGQVSLHSPRGPNVAHELVVLSAPRILLLLEFLSDSLVLLLALHVKRNACIRSAVAGVTA